MVNKQDDMISPAMFPCRLLAIVLLLILSGCVVNPCSPPAQTADSRWKVINDKGVSWLLPPSGTPFFSLGVNVLNTGYPERIFQGRLSYHWGTFYPDQAAWARDARQRVVTWGFNTAGAWSSHPDVILLPVIPDLELGRTASFHWFDPFDPATAKKVHDSARELVAPYKGNPCRIGYFLDNEVGWWNGALFIWYSKQPATNHTKQRLVGLLRDYYENDWSRFNHDFLPPPGVTSFAALLQHKDQITQLRPGGGGFQVIRRFTGMVAEQYYRLLHGALREADPEALIFSDRLPIYYDPDAVRMMAPYVDLIATNYDIDSPDGWIARYYFDGLRQLTANKPVLISEWFFAAHENRTGNLNNGHLMTVQTQAERARGAVAAAWRLAEEPQIVGLHWFQYYDHPQGGRPDGEDYNFGLVDNNNRPYEDLTAAFSLVNPVLARIHEQGQHVSPAAAVKRYEIPEADIHLDDSSLRDWPKEVAFVPGLTAQPQEVVFGDLYLAWNGTGVYLATISMDYYDPLLLAFGDTFPSDETFRIEWGIDAGAGPHRFSLNLLPQKVLDRNGAPLILARLRELDGADGKPVPAAMVSYRGAGNPRFEAEVFIPWKAMGVDGPPPDKQMHMELAVTSFFRSRWMSWSGFSPQTGLQYPARWRIVKLGPASS